MAITRILEHKWFHNFIIAVIIFNGIILGYQTSKGLSESTIRLLDVLDMACLAIFVIEIVMKLYAYRLSFFKDGWNNFDFIIVAIALVPTTGGLAILRAFRIFRVLRLVTTVDSIRRVVSGMLLAIPGVGSVGVLLVIVFYIGAVICTTLFGDTFPDWFGNIGQSMYTLFQVMTLESWSMGIVRPVMEVFPYAWIFFIPFITVTTFTVLNLFIGIIVDAMATIKEQDQIKKAKESDVDEHYVIQKDIAALREHLDILIKDVKR
ncbi:ion transport protein [Solemya velum gill symbiont]|uniref:Ion transport protein n=1 Tax=Solemya velum gill symbiont TaxID=2340 RepID=A0A0B0H4E1_SOVGS|nr:ion transporter [Solemya velum gill symbiont]KHF25078.1 ion transport protein [Solemya velum gill symbiont]